MKYRLMCDSNKYYIVSEICPMSAFVIFFLKCHGPYETQFPMQHCRFVVYDFSFGILSLSLLMAFLLKNTIAPMKYTFVCSIHDCWYMIQNHACTTKTCLATQHLDFMWYCIVTATYVGVLQCSGVPCQA
jgi:hypothetical protein